MAALTKTTFEATLASVGQALAIALERVLATVAGPVAGPQQLADALGLDKGSASRLLKAVRSRDALALAYLIPGPEPLRRILRAAARRGVAPGLTRDAENEVRRFEALIQSAGDRSAFDGIVGLMLPEARRQYEARTKQLLYRGMVQLKGFSVDVDFTIILVHPSGDDKHVDYVAVTGVLGLRRLRPDAVIRLGVWNLGPDMPVGMTTLDGAPIECLSTGRLDEFCSAQPATLDVSRVQDTIFYTLGDESFGPNSVADLVLAQWSHAPAPLFSPPGVRRRNGVGAEVDKPTRRLHLDVLVCEGVYPGSPPHLTIYDTTFRGMANINDPCRALDRLDLLETVEVLDNPEQARTSYIPRYGELLRHVAQQTGWNLERFRGYRCVVDHPIYGTQVGIGFERPQQADAAT